MTHRPCTSQVQPTSAAICCCQIVLVTADCIYLKLTTYVHHLHLYLLLRFQTLNLCRKMLISLVLSSPIVLLCLMLQWHHADAFVFKSSLLSLHSRLKMSSTTEPTLRIGHGWDIHRLVEGKPLVIGGVTLPHSMGADAHRCTIFRFLHTDINVASFSLRLLLNVDYQLSVLCLLRPHGSLETSTISMYYPPTSVSIHIAMGMPCIIR